MVDIQQQLTERLAPAFTALAGEPADPVVRRSDRADFQANGALQLARRLGRAPREVATEVLQRAELDDVCSVAQVAGPGFINLTVADGVIARSAADMARDDRLGVAADRDPQIVVVDYSAPNTAKEMHVGHLRSTIIGDAAVRTLEWMGHTLIRQNHIGDWGTPFGMLIEHLLDIGEEEAAHELSVGALGTFYQAARKKFDADEGFRDRARLRVVALQGGDQTTLRLWRVLTEESTRYFQTVYDTLDVTLSPADIAGESSYNDQLHRVAAELDRLGLLTVSDGAKCVFPTGFVNRDGNPMPLIIQKSDGGFGYDTTDLAAIRHRIRGLGAARSLYVVGLPQKQHFEMIFQAAREAGWLAPPVRAELVGHGSVLGSDRKILRTRAGASVKLIDLLTEAVARATALVAEKNPHLDETSRASVAHVVGIGAVKYADLSNDRGKDYVFDWSRMLAFDGNTAPYLQYAHARIRSIFRRGGVEAPGDLSEFTLTEPAERTLAVELLGFERVVREVAESLEFHRLCDYLFRLATTFTGFYEHCPVLKADPALRPSRLALCDLTARVLAQGLDLLGITSPDQM